MNALRHQMHEIIFEADTPAGRAFDLLLIVGILGSVLAVMLDSVQSIRADYGTILLAAEWGFTILFSIEYIARLYCVGKPLKYATSFFGIVDLLSILPTFLSLFFPGTQYLLVIRTLRTIRIWRILKLAQYLHEWDYIVRAIRASTRKITVFLVLLITLITILGSLMYLVESEEHGFTSIPRSIYWAIVTITTVGYGDISPQSDLGQFFAAIAMILGYAIIAVPTGIVTVELNHARRDFKVSTQACPECAKEGHDHDAQFCKFCGAKL
ncbi:ion transporter [Acanthopleuribacter pedis]|uniref:Ion transporter n=1 Tax=Acanthopleuribacter pedis TaxID=442870 RepID=A0A8J7Q484_9BACT|nr:ion transporter [Acanthopleuribacter pedis]MBO1317416.1 ion transporter [Acanthopleuribacter pedis]